MEPQLDKSPQPGLALPQPSREQGANGFEPYQPGQGAPEMAPAGPEAYAQPAAPSFAAPAAGAYPAAMPLPSAAPAAPVQDAQAAAVSPDDQENIDQEWISKAKAIVAQTKADPYIESQEIGKAKAEYLRIRYNKHLKVAEEQAR